MKERFNVTVVHGIVPHLQDWGCLGDRIPGALPRADVVGPVGANDQCRQRQIEFTAGKMDPSTVDKIFAEADPSSQGDAVVFRPKAEQV